MPENYISIIGEKGSVNISDNVIAVIARAAVTETDGIAGFSNGGGSGAHDGKKSQSRGVRASFSDDGITVDAAVMVCYGRNIARVASEAQNAVASAVSSMTGINPIVNIHVCGVALDK